MELQLRPPPTVFLKDVSKSEARWRKGTCGKKPGRHLLRVLLLGRGSEQTKGLQWSKLRCLAKPVWNSGFPYRPRSLRTGLHLSILVSQEPITKWIPYKHILNQWSSQSAIHPALQFLVRISLKFFNWFTHIKFPRDWLNLASPPTQVDFFTDLFFRGGVSRWGGSSAWWLKIQALKSDTLM